MPRYPHASWHRWRVLEMSFSGMHNHKVDNWRSEKYSDFPISMKVSSIDVTDCLAVDSVYSVRVLFSFSPSGINGVDGWDVDVWTGFDASAVEFELDVDMVVGVAFGVVASAAASVRVFHMSLRTMFLKWWSLLYPFHNSSCQLLSIYTRLTLKDEDEGEGNLDNTSTFTWNLPGQWMIVILSHSGFNSNAQQNRLELTVAFTFHIHFNTVWSVYIFNFAPST